jgi:hypothetical protein
MKGPNTDQHGGLKMNRYVHYVANGFVVFGMIYEMPEIKETPKDAPFSGNYHNHAESTPPLKTYNLGLTAATTSPTLNPPLFERMK